jgi:hypothetical protein
MHLKRLPLVSVKQPCHVSWESMEGSETARQCAECHRYVYNLSAMRRAEAELLLDNPCERLCIMFTRGPDGQVVTHDRPARFALRPIAGVAAALATAVTLTMPGVVEAGTIAGSSGVYQKRPAPAFKQPRGGLQGTVRTQIGEVDDDASITAQSLATTEEFSTRTAKDGRYRLALPKGRYRVEIRTEGFATCIVERVDVGTRLLRADAILSLRPIGEYVGFDACGNSKLRKLR